MRISKHFIFSRDGENRFISVKLLSLFFLVNCAVLQAQEVFPVNVVGNSLTPPYSMILSEYATIRANNIAFTVTLNDPVEASRDVYFRIIVLNNGKEILRTKPNFRGVPTTLFQYTPVMLTGLELAEYFKPENLTGGQINSSNLLPEGFNQICLEVVDLQREVVISNQGCVGAFFQLFEPPFLELPVCYGDLMMPIRGTSTLFKWLPRHLGLPGAPTMVEYILEIVELTPGIGNPNDAFDRAWKVGIRNTMATSWLWLETDPPLEVGKKYGWRVQAVDLSGSQGTFENNGYSAVCTFEVKRKVVPRYTINDCHPENTEYPLVPSYGPESTNLKVGETVYLGYYDLEILEIYQDFPGYSGKGQIYIPFLKCNISVDFSNMQVNEDNYVYAESGIYAENNNVSEDALLSDPAYWVSEIRQNGGGKNGPPRGMSLVLDKIIDNKDTVNVVVEPLTFTPQNSYASSYSVVRDMRFDKSDIAFAPSGPQQGNDLTLSTTSQTDYLNALDPHLHLIFGDTKVEWDCEGAERIEIKAYYEFEHEQGLPKNETVQGDGIPANGKAKALLTLPFVGADDFIIKPDIMDTLMMKEPFPLMTAHETVIFDFSLTSNIQGMSYPEHYTNDGRGLTWRGFVFESGKLAFPEEWDLTDGDGMKMKRNTFLVDSLATFGLHAENRRFMKLEDGNIGDWRLRIDSLYLVVDETMVDSLTFRGRTGPKVSRPTVPYRGVWSANGVSNEAPITAAPPYYYLSLRDTLGLPLWHSFLVLDSLRSHMIGQPDYDATTGTYGLKGKSDLFGQFNITPTMEDVDDNLDNIPAIDSLKIKARPLGDYNISSMNLYVEHFQIDHPDNPSGKAFYTPTYNAGNQFNIGNANMTMDIMVLPELDSFEVRGKFQKTIGVHISDENFPMQVKVWGIDPNNDGFYTFGMVELIPEALLGPDQPFICDCNPSPPAVICSPEPPADTAPVPVNIGDVVDMGGFKFVIENPGLAKLRVPFLKKTIDVSIENVTANADGIALGGSATALYDVSLTGGESDVMNIDFTEEMMNAILANTDSYLLPLAVGEQIIESASDIGETVVVPKEFTLTRMYFTPNNAKSDGILFKGLSNSKYLIFKGSDFDTRINGFNFPSIPFYLLKSVTL